MGELEKIFYKDLGNERTETARRDAFKNRNDLLKEIVNMPGVFRTKDDAGNAVVKINHPGAKVSYCEGWLENIGIGDLVKITNEFRTASHTVAAKMRVDLQNRPKMMNNNNNNDKQKTTTESNADSSDMFSEDSKAAYDVQAEPNEDAGSSRSKPTLKWNGRR